MIKPEWLLILRGIAANDPDATEALTLALQDAIRRRRNRWTRLKRQQRELTLCGLPVCVVTSVEEALKVVENV